MSLILKYDLGNPHRLPVGYTPLAYIESTGTLYINTGFKRTSTNFKAYIKVSLKHITSGELDFFGSYASGANAIVAGFYQGSYAFFWTNSNNAHNNNSIVRMDDVHNVICTLTDSSKSITIDEISATTNATIHAEDTNNIYLFRGGASYRAPEWCRIYSCIIWLNNSVILEYIPAKRNSDGVIGMFDIVSQTFFTNQGTGSFIAGPEVVVLPYEYLLVEYLKGNGLEWIDTGVSCGTTDIVNTTWTLDSTEANGEWQGINGQMQLSIANNSASDGANTISISKLTNVEYNYNNGSSTLKVGSTSYTRSWGLRTALNIYLWKLSNYSGALNNCKISKFYADKAGAVVRNMVACYRRSDMKPGMYDTVNNVFYTNAGSGEFILGPVIEESSRLLEYNNAGSNYIGKPTNVHHSVSNPSTTQINEGSGDFSGGATIRTTIPALNNSYSISWWANGVYGGKMMWSIGNLNPLYNLCLNSGDSNEDPWYRPGTTTQITAPSNNVWHHFVVTGDGSSNKLYVDGVHYGTAKTYKSCTGLALGLNYYAGYAAYQWNGKMYDFRIYNNVLTADEVLQIYKGGL